MADSFLERIQGASRLSDSLRGLLTEALHLQAESLTFTPAQGVLQIAWAKGGQEIKTSEMNAGWSDALQEWFEMRQCPVFGGKLLPVDEERGETAAAACLEGQSVIFTLKKTQRRGLRLSGFRRLSIAEVLRCFSFSEPFNSNFEQIAQSQNGVFLLASPDPLNLRHFVAGFLAFGDFVYAGDAASEELRDHIAVLSRDRTVIISTLGEDAVAGLLRLRELSYPLTSLSIKAAVCGGFVRAVCVDCAREAVPDRASLEALPPVLKPPLDLPYFVGRGCSVCGHSGYLGFVGIQSAALPNQALLEQISKGANHSKLVELLYPLGTASLLEDGLRKLRKGRITYESLFKFVRSAPLAYLKEAQRKQDEESIVIDAPPASSAGAEKPLAGSAVFSKDPRQNVSSGKNRPILLIVEDDPDQRSILEMVFKGADYDVRIASGAEHALTLLKREIPDLIISDLMMPGMDGREFVLRLKAEARLRDIPVLILTVVSDSDKEYALLDIGADDYCEKTIQRKILLKRVANLLKRSKR